MSSELVPPSKRYGHLGARTLKTWYERTVGVFTLYAILRISIAHTVDRQSAGITFTKKNWITLVKTEMRAKYGSYSIAPTASMYASDAQVRQEGDD